MGALPCPAFGGFAPASFPEISSKLVRGLFPDGGRPVTSPLRTVVTAPNAQRADDYCFRRGCRSPPEDSVRETPRSLEEVVLDGINFQRPEIVRILIFQLDTIRSIVFGLNRGSPQKLRVGRVSGQPRVKLKELPEFDSQRSIHSQVTVPEPGPAGS